MNSEGDECALLHHLGQPDGHNQAGQHLSPEPLIQHPVDQGTQCANGNHGNQPRQRIGQRNLLEPVRDRLDCRHFLFDQYPHQVGTEHQKGAVRKIDDVQHTENEAEPGRRHHIQTGEHQSVEKRLHEEQRVHRILMTIAPTGAWPTLQSTA